LSSLLHRIAVFSARHRVLVIGVWLVLLAGLVLGSHAAGTRYSSNAQVAGSDSADTSPCPPAGCHSARSRRGSAFLLRRVAVVQRQRVAVGVQADRLPAHARVERIADEADALGLKPLPRDGNVGNL